MLNYIYLITLIIVMLTLGCNNGETEKLKADLNKARLEAAKIKKENVRLKDINKKIQADYNDVKSDYDNFKIKHKEIEDWSGALAKLYGPSIWNASRYDRPLPFELLKSATPSLLIDKLNILFKKSNSPEVILVKIVDATVFVKISDDEQLTRRMGTTGAAGYLKTVAYTLSSIESVKCVDFDFVEGDHAIPGKLCP